MSEKKKIDFRIQPEIFSQSYWLTKFVNKFMQRGRKDAVKKIVFRVFKKIKIQHHKNALQMIFFALVKYRPHLGFFSVRVGREKKKIPFPLRPRRQLIMSFAWLVFGMRLLRYRNYNIPMEKILYSQLKAIFFKERNIFTSRRRTHIRELIENRVNLHFRHKLNQ